jgi:hypothetical protein
MRVARKIEKAATIRLLGFERFKLSGISKETSGEVAVPRPKRAKGAAGFIGSALSTPTLFLTYFIRLIFLV